MGEHAAKRISAGLVAEMAADITDAQAALGIACIAVQLDRSCEWLGVALVPQRAFSLLVGRRRGWIEVEREDQIAVQLGIVGAQRERAPIALDRVMRPPK